MFLNKSSDAQTAKKNLLANSSLGIEYVLAGDEVTAAGFGDPSVSSPFFSLCSWYYYDAQVTSNIQVRESRKLILTLSLTLGSPIL